MYELILCNFAMHIALAPHQQEQVLALLQQKTVAKRSVLLQPGEVDRHIYFVNEGCLRMFHTNKDY